MRGDVAGLSIGLKRIEVLGIFEWLHEEKMEIKRLVENTPSHANAGRGCVCLFFKLDNQGRRD